MSGEPWSPNLDLVPEVREAEAYRRIEELKAMIKKMRDALEDEIRWLEYLVATCALMPDEVSKRIKKLRRALAASEI